MLKKNKKQMLNIFESGGVSGLSFCLRLVFTAFSTVLFYFFAVRQSVNPLLTASVLLLSYACSAACMPFVRIYIEKLNFKAYGSYHFIIICGIILLAAAVIPVWTVPAGLHAAVKLVILFFCCFSVSVLYNIIGTAAALISRELAGSNGEHLAARRRNTYFELAGCAAGLLTAGLCAGLNINDGFEQFAYLLSTIIILCGILFFFATFSHFPRLRAKAVKSQITVAPAKEIFVSFFKLIFSKSMRLHFVALCLISAGISIVSAYLLIAAESFMGVSFLEASLALMCVFVFAAGSLPLWRKLQRNNHKVILLEAAVIVMMIMILGVLITFSVTVVTGSSNVFTVLMFILAAVGGAAYGGVYTLSRNLFANLLTDSNETVSETQGRMLGVVPAFINAAGLITGLFVAGLTLTVFGYKSGGFALVTALGSTLLALLIAIGCFVAALVILKSKSKVALFVRTAEEEQVQETEKAEEYVPEYMEEAAKEEAAEEVSKAAAEQEEEPEIKERDLPKIMPAAKSVEAKPAKTMAELLAGTGGDDDDDFDSEDDDDAEDGDEEDADEDEDDEEDAE